MKKSIVLALGLMMAGSTFAAGKVCTNGVATGDGVEANGTYKLTTNQFVVTTFPVKCSTNVEASTAESAIAIAVGAYSKKGKSGFRGGSGGGSVKPYTTCNGPCTDGLDTNGLQDLLNMAT